jgi:fructose-bisphosphate aldolase class II
MKHGTYAETPLVLHGGSGLSDDDFRNCISKGISKINIYTDVITAALDTIKKNNRNLQYVDINRKVEEAVYILDFWVFSFLGR